ncbi:MAG: PAS domain S-box protein [Spirochaetaceae bacterium]
MSKKILLVEDEALIAMSEAQMLKKHGYEVVTTHNGEKAIEAIATDPDISLILMDIDLGKGMDGTEAAEEILTRHDVPIVFLTSHSEKEYVDRVKKITGYGYVLKSSGEFVLMESIQMAYTLFEANRDLRRENRARRASEEELTALYTHTPVLMLLVDKERRVRKANAFAGHFAGTPAEEMIGERAGEALRCMHHLDDPRGCGFGPFCRNCTVRDLVVSTFASGEAYRRTEATLPFLRQGEEEELTILVSTSLLHQENEDLCMVAFEDVTEYKQLQERYKALFENAPLPYQSLDGEGRFLEVNPAWLDALGGYTREEVIGTPFADYLHPDSIDDFKDNLERLKESGTARGNTYRMRRKSGEYMEAAFDGTMTYTSEGEARQTHCIFKDVTEERRLQRELEESEEKFRTIFEDSPLGIFRSTPEGRFLQVNQTLATMLGYSSPRAVVESIHSIAEQVYVSSEDRYPIVEAQLGSDDVGRYCNVYQRADGSRFVANLYLKTIRDAGGNVRFLEGIVEDITERKQAEDALRESVLRLDELIANVPVGIYIAWIQADGRTKFTYVSDRWCAIHKVRREDVIADAATVTDQVHHDERAAFLERNLEAARDHKPFLWEGRFVVGNGDLRWLRIESNPTVVEKGDTRWFGVTQDITERRRAEGELQQALQEKDLLMRELNHRIKNNLGMVSSLINLKAADTDTDLSDIQRQIDAIGLIHEKLHQSESVTELPVRGYIGGLLSSVFSSFSARPVRIEEDIDHIYIPTKSALSLGLVINEIATNAMKHGFTATGEAVFRVKMKKDRNNGRYEVTLSNTGKPFPAEIDLDNPQTLGLRIVSALTAQLDGTIELQRAPHPVFTIRFPTSV